jgi:rubredoxin
MIIRSGFRYKCRACGLVYVNKVGFTNHFLKKHLQMITLAPLMTIRSGFRYKCRACGLVYVNKVGFTNHFLKKHLQKVYEVKEK